MILQTIWKRVMFWLKFLQYVPSHASVWKFFTLMVLLLSAAVSTNAQSINVIGNVLITISPTMFLVMLLSERF